VNAAMARKASPARAPLPVRKAAPAEPFAADSKPVRRSGRANTILLTLAAIGLSLTAAAWITSPDLSALASALPGNADRPNFADRFVSVPKSTTSALLQPLKRLVMAKADLELSTTRDALASRWPQGDDLRPAIADETAIAPALGATVPAAPATTTTAAVTSAVPLPRSRPAAAEQPVQSVVALANTNPPTGSISATTDSAPRPAERSVFQKFSDMMKSKMAVASLGLGKAPDLTALGYDNETAVYDITAHAVYLPNGTVMEAHSGMGNLRDDPDHVNMPMVGATPPAMYSLKPRETSFHGVAALRMTPAEGSDIGGRSGLLVHSYMLGPNGDSNGCISVRDFDRFRKAYDDGQFTHIAVVSSVKAMILAQAQQNAD